MSDLGPSVIRTIRQTDGSEIEYAPSRGAWRGYTAKTACDETERRFRMNRARVTREGNTLRLDYTGATYTFTDTP